MSTAPAQVVRTALSGELRLILSLVGVRTGVGGAQAVTDADGMLDDLTRVVLNDLRDAGHAVVELPKPTSDFGQASWELATGNVWVDGPDLVGLQFEGGGRYFYLAPKGARELAAALLAAADAAERIES